MIINTEIDMDYGDEMDDPRVLADSGMQPETATYIDEDGIEQRVMFFKDETGAPRFVQPFADPYFLDAEGIPGAHLRGEPLTEQERMDLIE